MVGASGIITSGVQRGFCRIVLMICVFVLNGCESAERPSPLDEDPRDLDKSLFVQLHKQVAKEINLYYAWCRKKAPKETFFGLAICVDNSVRSCYLQAATEERLKHPGDRFFINEWGFQSGAKYANGALDAVWNASRLKQLDLDCGQIRKKCLRAVMQGLIDFRKSRLLPSSMREDFALIIYDPDPGDSGVQETIDIARELNSQKTFRRFIALKNGFPFGI